MIIDHPVVIDRDTMGVSRQGFGTILVHDPNAEGEFMFITEKDLKDFEEGAVKRLISVLFAQKPAPARVAIAGGDIEDVAGEDFFFITTPEKGVESIKKYGDFAAANSKMFFNTINDVEEAVGLKDYLNENVVVMYHENEEEFPAEALAVVMSYDVGGRVAHAEQLNAVAPSNVSLTNYEKLLDAGVITYIRKMGVAQVDEGITLSGEYIDVVLGEYWIRTRMEEDVMHFKLKNKKVAYTNRGIGGLAGVAEGVLSDAVGQGIIMDGQYEVKTVPREQVSANDVANRYYDGVHWRATLSGAIQKGPIKGRLGYDLVIGGDE